MRRFWLDLGDEVRRMWKTAGFAVAAVGALALVAAFFPDPIATFLRLLGLVFTGLMLFSVVVTVLTFRRARSIRPAALVFAIGTSLVCTGFNLVFAARPPSPAVFALAIGAGASIGAAWSLTTLLFVDGEDVRGRGTLWYLVVWALTLVVNQGAALVLGRTPAVATITMLVGAGLAVANSAGLALRVREVERWRSAVPGDVVGER